MKIVTATGKEYQALWCAVSSIDQALRFSILNQSLQNIVGVFSDHNETSTLIYKIDNMENEKEYIGYTTLTGVNLEFNGSIVVSLQQS